MEASGKVIQADIQKGTSASGREWQKKVFIIEYAEGTTPKRLAFEIFGEDNIKANSFRVGQKVTVYFEIECKEWNGRWFTSLRATRVTKLGDTSSTEDYKEPEMLPQREDEELPF